VIIFILDVDMLSIHILKILFEKNIILFSKRKMILFPLDVILSSIVRD
jgi:hypothetical protein